MLICGVIELFPFLALFLSEIYAKNWKKLIFFLGAELMKRIGKLKLILNIIIKIAVFTI
jgi:hypothetical protein